MKTVLSLFLFIFISTTTYSQDSIGDGGVANSVALVDGIAKIDMHMFKKCSNFQQIALPIDLHGTYASSSGESLTLDEDGLSILTTKYIRAGSEFAYELYSNMCIHQRMTGKRLVINLKTSESLFFEGGLKQKIVIKFSHPKTIKVGQKRVLRTGFMKSGVSISGAPLHYINLQKVEN